MEFGRWPEMPQKPHLSSISQRTTETYAHLYNAPQQSYSHHYPYYSQYHSQNPNPSFDPPDLPSAISRHDNPLASQFKSDIGSSIRTPGVDPFALNPYAPHAGLDSQAVVPTYGHHAQSLMGATAASYYQDPSLQQTWGAKEAIRQFGTNPVGGYPAGVIRASSMDHMVAANPNPMLWNNQMVHRFPNGAMKRGSKKTKIVQSAWCEVCKIDCNSQDVLNTHKQGKKHKKNLEKLQESKNAPAATTAPAPAPPTPAPTLAPTPAPTTPAPATATLTTPAAKSKKSKKKGNSPGEKDKNVAGQVRKGAPPSEPGEDLETKKRKLMEGGAPADSVRVCEVCNVACNSQTVFNYHIAGQKHAAQVKKLAAAGAGGAVAAAGR